MSGVFIIFGLAVTFIIVFWFGSKAAEREKKEYLEKNKFKGSKLMSVLLRLDKTAINELLSLYKAEFGNGPARYARLTYRKWKTGEVQANAQTFDRFLVHLPKVMSFELKCEILRHYMEEYAAKDHHELNVTTTDWEEKLTPLVTQVIEKAFTAQLPQQVEKQLKWLVDGDMKSAQQVLKASQAEEGRIMVSMLKEEFIQFEKILDNRHLRPKVSHELKFPYGTIKINIKS